MTWNRKKSIKKTEYVSPKFYKEGIQLINIEDKKWFKNSANAPKISTYGYIFDIGVDSSIDCLFSNN